MSASWSLGEGTSLPLLCFVEIHWLHVHRRGVRGYGYIHGYPRKNPWMDMDMDGKFHIHGKPDNTIVWQTDGHLYCSNISACIACYATVLIKSSLRLVIPPWVGCRPTFCTTCSKEKEVKGKGKGLGRATCYSAAYVDSNSSALQSRKWQLIGMS